MKRRLWKTLAAAAGLALAASAAAAQGYPAKPVRIIVPYSAGGFADTGLRALTEALGARLGQTVVVDNRPGAGGAIGVQAVAQAAPDGHTLLLGFDGTLVVYPHLVAKLPFDTLKDFAWVSTMATFDLAIVVADGGRFKTLGELLAYAKANPGKVNIGTPNVGTTQNLAAELFKATAGIDMQVVPFNGTPPVITALRGGQIDAGLDILGPLMPQIASKALRPLAVLGDKRAPQLPDVPAANESGGALASFKASSWNGLAVPAKTPRDVVARLGREVQAAVAQPDVKQRLLELNLVAQGSTPEQLGSLMASEVKRWSEVIAQAKIPRQ